MGEARLFSGCVRVRVCSCAKRQEEGVETPFTKPARSCMLVLQEIVLGPTKLDVCTMLSSPISSLDFQIEAHSQRQQRAVHHSGERALTPITVQIKTAFTAGGDSCYMG